MVHPTWARPGLASQEPPWPCRCHAPGLHTAPESHGCRDGTLLLPCHPGPSGWMWPWGRSGQPGYWAWPPPPLGGGQQPQPGSGPRPGERPGPGCSCVPGWTCALEGLGGPLHRASGRGLPWEPYSSCCQEQPSGCPGRPPHRPGHPCRMRQAWSHPAWWPPSAAAGSEPQPLARGPPWPPPHSRPPPSGHKPALGLGWGPCWQRPPGVGHIHRPGAARGPRIGLRVQVGSGPGERSLHDRPLRKSSVSGEGWSG